jgi:two-component system C4-dicarboxylate transport response regulator DctD
MSIELKVLIVEDDPNVRLGCEQALQLAGFKVMSASSAEEAMPRLVAGFPGVVVSDVRLPGADGLALLRYAQERDRDLPVIMITGHGGVSMAVDAMRCGAYDFIEKPFAPEHLVEVVRRALEKRALTLEVGVLRRQLAARDDIGQRLIGQSPQIEQVRRLVRELAITSVDILIHGETGAGKEMVASCLHDMSPRKQGNFVALNCGGLPDNLLDSELFGHEPGAFTGAQKRRIGKIEYANGGTLFLDEVESMPINVQVKLLRVLQERCIERLGSNQRIPVDCRVIAATKDDLKVRAERGLFRADLYYRLNVVGIDLPPLRERREDIPPLLEHFMLLAAGQHQRPLPVVDGEAMRRLMAHDWPGNVRELRNAADCLVLGVGLPLLGAPGNAPPSLAAAVENFERALIATELKRHDGQLGKTADALRIPKTTLHDKIRKYGLVLGRGEDA